MAVPNIAERRTKIAAGFANQVSAGSMARNKSRRPGRWTSSMAVMAANQRGMPAKFKPPRGRIPDLHGIDLGDRDGIQWPALLVGDRHRPSRPIAVAHQFAHGEI